MSHPVEKLPSQLTAWVDGQTHQLEQLARELSSICESDKDKPAAWALNLLEELSNVETISRRMVHLLTTYTLREGLASPTVVAKRTAVTVTAAQNRAGSRLAQEMWNEVWPRSENPA